jgi:hypothetical protein
MGDGASCSMLCNIAHIFAGDETDLFGAKTIKQLGGAIAQLGERLHGMQEVGGPILPVSTRFDR